MRDKSNYIEEQKWEPVANTISFLLRGFASRVKEKKAWVYCFAALRYGKEVSVRDIGKETDFNGNPREGDLGNENCSHRVGIRPSCQIGVTRFSSSEEASSSSLSAILSANEEHSRRFHEARDLLNEVLETRPGELERSADTDFEAEMRRE